MSNLVIERKVCSRRRIAARRLAIRKIFISTLSILAFVSLNMILFKVGQAEHPETEVICRFLTSFIQSSIICGLIVGLKYFFIGLLSD